MEYPTELNIADRDRVLCTDPIAMEQLIRPEKLAIPGNFFVSDALNMYEELGYYKDVAIADGGHYPVQELRLHSGVPYMQPTESQLVTIPGNEQQGIGVAVLVDRPESLNSGRTGPLVRMHSACGYSEIGIPMTSQIYRDPSWVYRHRDKLLPMFMSYGDQGMIMGYPRYPEEPDDPDNPDEPDLTEMFSPSLDCDCRSGRHPSASHSFGHWAY